MSLRLACAPLRKAVELSNKSPLIEMLLGQPLVASDNEADAEEVITTLGAAVDARMGQGRRYRRCKTAAGSKERPEIKERLEIKTKNKLRWNTRIFEQPAFRQPPKNPPQRI
jgi:hypothetical protein